MIELDVQLSKERIPIIYHDFDVQTYFINRHNSSDNETIKIPFKDLSLKTLEKISTNFMPEIKSNESLFSQSFETLEDVLKYTDPKCGIDVEIKYPSQLKNGNYESELGIELNEYVDRILKVLFDHGGDRPMFITSFHGDLCSMIRLKQNKYHVGFLTSVKRWTNDPRDYSIESAVAFSQSMKFKGIVPVVDPILNSKNDDNGRYEYIDYVKKRNISLYLWGGKIDNKNIVNKLLKQNVDLLIFDKIDKIIN